MSSGCFCILPVSYRLQWEYFQRRFFIRRNKPEQWKNQGKEKVTLSIWAGEEDKEYITAVTQKFIKEYEKMQISILNGLL